MYMYKYIYVYIFVWHVYVYICIYIYVNIHMLTHSHTHKHIRTYIYTGRYRFGRTISCPANAGCRTWRTRTRENDSRDRHWQKVKTDLQWIPVYIKRALQKRPKYIKRAFRIRVVYIKRTESKLSKDTLIMICVCRHDSRDWHWCDVEKDLQKRPVYIKRALYISKETCQKRPIKGDQNMTCACHHDSRDQHWCELKTDAQKRAVYIKSALQEDLYIANEPYKKDLYSSKEPYEKGLYTSKETDQKRPIYMTCVSPWFVGTTLMQGENRPLKETSKNQKSPSKKTHKRPVYIQRDGKKHYICV